MRAEYFDPTEVERDMRALIARNTAKARADAKLPEDIRLIELQTSMSEIAVIALLAMTKARNTEEKEYIVGQALAGIVSGMVYSLRVNFGEEAYQSFTLHLVAALRAGPNGKLDNFVNEHGSTAARTGGGRA